MSFKKIIDYGFSSLIIFLSFFIFSPSYSNLLNSDKAIHILMANDLNLPYELYYWGQDRLGSLVPILAGGFAKLTNLHVILSISIINYLLLICTFYILRGFLRNLFSRLLLCFVLFVPFPMFIEQISLGHPYNPQYFLLVLSVLLYKHATSSKSIWQSLFWFFSCLVLFLSIWVSEFSVVFIFSAIIVSGLKMIHFEKEQERISLTVSLSLKRFITLTFLLLAAIYLNYIFISYAKINADKQDQYNILFSELGKFKNAFADFTKTFYEYLVFKRGDMFLSIHNCLISIILVALIFLFIQKIKNKKPFRVGLKEVFLINAIAGYLLLLASNWVSTYDYRIRYFTYAYISLFIFLALHIDQLEKKPRIIISSLYAIALLTMSVSSYSLEKVSYKADLGNFSWKKIKRFEHLKNCGVIGDYWFSYILAINNPDSVISISHEKTYVRGYRKVDEVFNKKTIYLVSNRWMDGFPDTVIQFGYTLKKTGPPFNTEGINFCKYEKCKQVFSFNYKQMLQRESVINTYKSSTDSLLFVNFGHKQVNNYVIYGPFITLHKGHYKAEISLDSLSITGNDNLIADVAENWGQRVYVSTSIKNDNSATKTISFLFDITATTRNVEFRLFLNGKSSFVFKKVELHEID